MNNFRQFITFFLCLCISSRSSAQKNVDLYYLCIGSEHYTLDFERFEPGFQGLFKLEAASESARKMAVLFDGFGARKGNVLCSTPEKLIASDNLFAAVDALVKLVKKENAPNPFVVIYYAGHGFSSPVLEGHFIPPGNFVHDPTKMDLDQWIEYGIAPLDIHEKLQQANLSHMIMLDCCYEGKQRPPGTLDPYVIKNLGLEQMDDLMKSTYSLLKAMNRMVGPDPVIFSAPVDSSVTPVPSVDDELLSVAPLCRRAYIIKNKAGNSKLSVKSFTEMMLDDQLDKLTRPGISFVSFDKQNEDLIKIK